MAIDPNIRIPLLPLSITRSNIAIPRELMIDYVEGLLYYKSKNGKRNVLINRDYMINQIMTKIKSLYGNVSGEYNTLFKIREILRDIELWKNGMMLPDDNNIVDTIVELLDKFKDMSNDSETIKQMLDSKVTKIEGKGLSDVDFTDEHLNKLNNIEFGANNYRHSLEKQCNYTPAIKSVNGKTGNVKITKDDLGLQNLDPNAIKYEHPAEKQCNVKAVISLNNKTDIVKLTKNDFELDNLTNYTIDHGVSLLNSNLSSNNKYLSPNGLFNIFNEYIHSNSNFINRYIGLAKDLITGNELSTLCGLTTGAVLTPNDIEWSKFFYMGSIIYYSNTIIRSGITFDTLLSKDLVEGKIITIKGKRYKCKLINSGIESYSSIYYKGELLKLSKSINFSDVKTEMKQIGSEFWCNDNIITSGGKIAFTSNLPIITDSQFTNKTATLSSKLTSNVSGWRPILELLDYEVDLSSSVTFNTTPSDANIQVLINESWVSGKTHTLEIGNSYRYTISKAGYITIDSYISPTQPIQNVYVSLVLEPPKEYTVNIITTPSDATARVYYNNKWNSGKVHYLPNGTYSVEVSRLGYITITQSIIISNNNYNINISLNPLLTINYNQTLDVGIASAIGLLNDNSILNWGADLYNNITNTPTSKDFKYVATGQNLSCAIKNNGSLVTWGYNLGNEDGGYPVSTTPSGYNFKQVQVADASFITALKTDGTLISWGYNNSYNGYAVSNTPKDADYIQISCNTTYALALKNNGTIKCWGDPDSVNNVIPSIPTNTKFIYVSAGGSNSLGIDANNSIHVFGDISTDIYKLKPSGNNFVSVACGLGVALALTNDGKIVSWGRDTQYNNYAILNTPKESGFIAISAGWENFAALKRDGSIVVWGGNNYNINNPPKSSGFLI